MSARRRFAPTLILLLAAAASAQTAAPTANPAPAPAAAPTPAPPAGGGNATGGGNAGGGAAKAGSTNDLLPLPGVNLQLTQPGSRAENYSSLQIMFLLTVIVLAPTMMMMLTGFTRIVVVLGFVRQAIGTHTVPPNQVLLGLSVFMTIFVMAPSFQQIQQNAITPFLAKQIDTAECVDRAMVPLRSFMLRNTRPNDLALFLEMSREPSPASPAGCPSYVLIPAFCVSELRTAFEIGFLIYIPFLVIDIVVASTIMSMGMMMLPPVTISLPFKLLLFVLVDGWHLVLRGLAQSFG
jgi:flagellar biosynthetic protein FliP